MRDDNDTIHMKSIIEILDSSATNIIADEVAMENVIIFIYDQC